MSFKRFFSSVVLLFALFGAFTPAMAQHDEPAHQEAAADHNEKEEGINMSELIFGHVSDAHSWHFFDFGGHPVSLPLPVIIYHPEKGLEMFSSSKFEHGHASYNGYSMHFTGMKEVITSADGAKILDFSITKNVLSMLISVVLLLWIMLSVAKKYKKNGVMKAPTGMQNALEPVIIFMRDEVAKPNLGNKYMRYMPLLLTIFFFIWINNLLGLLPGGANFTGNIAVTACLALVAFLVIIFSGNKHFWGHLFNPPGVPFLVKILLIIIEFLSLFIKPVALMIRLFANMLAGHIVILSVISMIFIFGAMSQAAGAGFTIVSLAFSIFMFMLELLVAAIQAFIFVNLTAVFVGQAIEDPHHDHDHGTEQDYQVSENEIIA